MINFIKKPIVIISLIILAGGIVGGYFYFGRNQAPSFDFVIAQKRDLIQEVSVTGRAEPAEEVSLAFEISGRVAQTLVKVGDTVAIGQALARLNDVEARADLAQARAAQTSAEAQLNQLRAAEEAQQAKLDELRKGIRPEELRIAERKAANAEQSLLDAKLNRIKVQKKADIDLANMYDDISDILQDVYAKTADAIYQKTDALFDNDNTATPKLTFLTSKNQTSIDSEFKRAAINAPLLALEALASTPPQTNAARDQSLIDADATLVRIRELLDRLSELLNASLGLSATTLAAYKSDLNAARSNINTALASITAQKQLIATQNVTNEKNIGAENALMNTAENALALARDELRLKQAGATAEQLRVQEAAVKQAFLNISSQEAAVKQAGANVQTMQARVLKTTLSAPFGGVITIQNARVGEIVSANTALISLISEAKFEIQANIPEADIAKVSVGNGALVTLDAYGRDVVFEAKVVAVDPAETIVDGVATYKATFQFAKNDERVKSGMTANIDIASANRENVIAVPQRAIIRKNGDQFVRILNGEDFEEVKVETGLRGSDGNIEIISGVSEGDKVITFSEE